MLIGSPGIGKAHVSPSLGVQSIEYHHGRARFFSKGPLVTALERDISEGLAAIATSSR
jgi:hypothetical protein